MTPKSTKKENLSVSLASKRVLDSMDYPLVKTISGESGEEERKEAEDEGDESFWDHGTRDQSDE